MLPQRKILIFNTLAGLPGNQLDRMQSVINAAARLVCSARKYEHITPLLRDLHWLLVRERIEFKLAVLVFRCLHGTAPPYLANELYRVAERTSTQEDGCVLRQRLLS